MGKIKSISEIKGNFSVNGKGLLSEKTDTVINHVVPSTPRSHVVESDKAARQTPFHHRRCRRPWTAYSAGVEDVASFVAHTGSHEAYRQLVV